MSADQEWSDAIKAGIGNLAELHSSSHQDTQSDFLPTSSQSPGNSPQPSPDSQQREPTPVPAQSPLASQQQHSVKNLPQAQQNYESQQDQHISQSDVPPTNTLQNYDPTGHSDNTTMFECEYHEFPETQVLQKSAQVKPSTQNVSKDNNNLPTVKPPPRSQNFSMKGQPQHQDAQMNTNLGHQISNRQPPNQPIGYRPVRHPQPQLSQQQKPAFSMTSGPRQTHGAGISAPPRFSNNSKTMKPNAQRFQQPHSHHQNSAGGRQQQQQKNIRAPVPSSTGGNMGLTRMPSPNVNTQKVRPQNLGPRPGQPRPFSPNQQQNRPPIQNQNVRPGTQSGQTRPVFNRPSGNRMPVPQGQSGSPFPNNQQGNSQPRQNFGPGLRMPEMSGVQHPGFDEEEMYNEDEEDEDDYDEDMDEDDMYPPGFQGGPGFDYPSSDNDELSEEEASLLEELSCCEDEQRYDEIVNRLREKGVDAEEIDEMMYNSNNFSQGLYPEEEFFDEDGEETVSSSSQGQLAFQQNQPRSQVGVSPNSGMTQGQPGTSTASSCQQGSAPSSVNAHSQGTVSKAPSGTPSQQNKNILPQGAQKQQQVPAIRPLGQNPSGQLPQIQHQLKFGGQTNSSQQRKVFQSSPTQSQPSSQASGWQPLQNIVRTQSPQVQQEQMKQPASTRPLSQSDQGLQAPRQALANRSPQQMTQGQSNSVRLQGQPQSTGGAGRPNQQLASIAGNNQGQQAQNQQFFARQVAPGQQMALNTSLNQQSGYVGTQAQVQPPMVRSVRPRMPLQMQQRPFGQVPQNTAFNQMMGPGSQRHFRPRNQNPRHQNLNSPQLKAALNKETAPSEARLARLAVMYMQQSLDEEIMAKKGGPSLPNQLCAQQAVRGAAPGGQQFPSQTRFPTPHQPGQFGQPVNSQHHPNQTFPSMNQPNHQLSFRQPNPTMMNPSSNTNQALSGGRPICSVVPITSQNRGPATPNTHKPNIPQLNANFPRPRAPAPSLLQSTSSPQHTGVFPNRMNSSGTQQSPQTPPTATAAPVMRNPVPATSMTQSQSQVVTMQSDPQQQQQGSKAETFSLDRLSEDKCIVTSKTGKRQGLVTNMVYQIRSPIDQSLVLALWNGEHFEDLKQKDVKGQSSSGTVTVTQPGQRSTPDSQQTQTGQSNQTSQASEKEKNKGTPTAAPGVSASKFQAEFLQSLSRKPDQEEQSWSNAESTPSSSQDVNTESGQGSDPNAQKGAADNQSTYVKPMTGPVKKEEPMEDEFDDSLFKKPYNDNEDLFRVCNNCGYTSKNFKRCDGCKKIFQGQVKIHSTKKNVAKSVASTSVTPASGKDSNGSQNEENSGQAGDQYSQVMNSISFYRNHTGRGRGRGARGGSGRTRGGGLKGRMGMRGNQGEDYDSSDSDEQSVDGKGSSDASRSSNEGQGKRRPARPKGKNPTPRKRSKKVDEPVTVTISSDEDEPSSTSNNLPFHAASPAHSAGSESPIFPSTPAEPINAFGRFRRALMEDEEGQSKLSKKMQQRPGASLMEREEEEEEDEDDDDDGDEPPIYEIDIRSVRIGSMRTQPEGPLLINLRGVCFKVRSERTEEAFECEILCQDVEHVKYFSGQTQPVLFLFLTQECGEKLRRICQMEPGDDEYFDPSSTDMKQKMVVIIIECFNYMPQDMLRETLSLWADMNHAEDEYFIEELTEESANDLLIQSAPPVLTADVERDIVKFKNRYLRDSSDLGQMRRRQGSPSGSTDNEPDSTSSSPPEIKHHFMGASVRLLQYPPAPARGIPITTEDLLCLSEGEFLNDVIIDFYLQYLYEEKLDEESRKRTHIFSSFFYKRLTQRDRHSEKTEEDAKKSLPERRHARVKKWTKTVDLFNKDFIIVPINEHSHWYLAVICFPGLATPEVVPFIPNTANKTEVDEESNDGGATEEGASEETTNQESVVKTILGKQLDPKQCLDNEESKYNLGQKQPCILMFDSLAGPSRNPNVKMLREYLQCEWNAKKSESRQIAKILRGSTPKVPQQSNYSDCGVYLLQYVESFFENPIADFQIPMKGLLNWFPEELVLNKRREIHELIMSLHRRFQEERGDHRILDIKFESTPREPPMRFNSHPEQNLKSEEGPASGIGRDDESSNSSMSGDMSKAEFRAMTQPSEPMPMDENSGENFEEQNEEQQGDESQEGEFYDQEFHSENQEEGEEHEEYTDTQQEEGNSTDH